jgi:signal peptidase I
MTRIPASMLGYGIAWVVVLLVGLWIAAECLVLPWVVVGRSMEPALSHGDRLLVDRWTYRHRLPRVGEIVLFEGPEEGVMMVKRAASQPGSTGAALGADPHRRRTPIAAGGIWLLGDNPPASRDSRDFGAVPAGRIRGRVVFRYWPLR